MSQKFQVRRAARRALWVAAAASAPMFPAFAADPAVTKSAEVVAEVVVTGTRILRPNLTAPTAVTTIDAEQVQLSGLGNTADLLRAVPSFGVSAVSTNNSNFNTASAGVNTLELRNLGEPRTLVLVNGRRFISGIPASASVDFNTIPLALVDRVEVITGGASAIYGSDALAGVVNVILKKDFEGAHFDYQFGEATGGGDIQNRATFTAGGEFAEGRGNAVISATFSEQKGLLSRERSNTRIDDTAACFFDPTQDCQTPIEPSYSTFSEFGRFSIPSTGQAFTIDNGAGPAGNVVPYDNTQFGFNRQAFRRYSVPTDRYLISSLFNYEVSEGVSAFVEATYAQTRTTSEIEPFPHSNDDLDIAGIPIDNPYVPQALRAAAQAAGDDVIEYRRRTTEFGQRGSTATRNTYRVVAGLTGKIHDRWEWENYYSFGRMDDSQQGSGQLNVLAMREALNAIDGDGDPATFDPICADEAARLEGCVPINLFGRGSISPEAAGYIRAPQSRQALTQQEIVGADFGGSVADLPAGQLNVVVGAEWRRERSEDVPDVLTQTGLNGGNKQPPIRGAFDVAEAFVEVDLPLLKELPLVHDLSIGGAYRESKYSTVGHTSAYTGRISWSPVESLRLRGQYARAVRAPDIGELFAPGGENFAPVSDPCQGVTAATPGNIAQNCRAVAAIAQRIAAAGVFDLTLAEQQGTGGFTGKGNPDLDVETSDSWSLGLIFDHHFEHAGGTTLSIDYFDIGVENTIGLVARQSAVDFCFDSDPAGFATNEFCGFLVRDATGPAFQLGELQQVNSVAINEGTLTTRGVDVALQWSLPELFARIPGQLALRLNFTHLLDFTTVQFDVPDDQVGETGFAEDEAQAPAVVYGNGPFLAMAMEFHFQFDPQQQQPGFIDFHVGGFSVHDLQFAFDFGKRGGEKGGLLDGIRLYVGANNVLDEQAPIILSGVPGNTTGTDTNANVYNPIGRTWYAGLNISF